MKAGAVGCEDKCNSGWQEETGSLASTLPLPVLRGTRPHTRPCWASTDLCEKRVTRALRDALLSLLLAEKPGPGPHSHCLTPAKFQQQYLSMHCFLNRCLCSPSMPELSPGKVSSSLDPFHSHFTLPSCSKAMSCPAALWLLWETSPVRAKTLVKVPWPRIYHVLKQGPITWFSQVVQFMPG